MTRDRGDGPDPWPAACILSGPSAATLLDRAARTIGARRVSSELHRLHHRPHRSVTRVDTAIVDTPAGFREALLVVHAHRAGLPHDAETVEVDGVQVAVWAYPHDPYLPGLPDASAPDRVAQRLAAVGLEAVAVTLHRRAYRATRGAVIEVHVTSRRGVPRSVFLKVLRTGRADRLAAVHRHLGLHLPVAPLLGSDPGVLVLGGLPGVPVRRLLRQGGSLPDPDRLVALSERLAPIAVDSGRRPDLRADPARHVAGLRADRPELRAEIDVLVAACREVGGPRGTVHGDLHGGQLLTADGEVTGLLDLDDVGPGRLVHDAANLIAYLEAQGDRTPAAADRARRYADEVARAYGGWFAPASLARATAARWLALAAVAHRSGDGPLVRRRIDRAGDLLDGT